MPHASSVEAVVSTRRHKRIPASTFLLLIAFCIYSSILIYRTSLVVDGKRFFLLQDDTMISMRYARNLAQGAGLVWNPGGERVEGFSNPLYVVFLSLFHFGSLPPGTISLAVQIANVAFLGVNLLVVRELAHSMNGRGQVAVGAAFLTAFYYPLNKWSLGGMEVGVLTLLTTTAVLLCIRSVQRGAFSPLPYILLGIGTLIRLDMVIPYVAVLSFFLVAGTERRKHLLAGASIMVGFVAAQTIFRMAYFGEILPNTYYLKLTGYPLFLRFTRGASVFFDFVTRFNWLLFVLPFAFGLWKKDRLLLLILWVVLLECLYSVYIGGDAWEKWGGANRFVSIAMPLFFIAFSCAVLELLLMFGPNAARVGAIFWGILALSLINFNYLDSVASLKESALIDPPYHSKPQQESVEKAEIVCAITKPSAKIAVVRAGIIPYLCERETVDLLGKNDRNIAHGPMHLSLSEGYTFFYPGHLKWDYKYSIGYLKPDVVVELWGDAKEALPALRESYIRMRFSEHEFFLRKDSPSIDWNQLGMVSPPR